MTAARGRTKSPFWTPFLPQTRSGRDEEPPQPPPASDRAVRISSGRRRIGGVTSQGDRRRSGYRAGAARERGIAGAARALMIEPELCPADQRPHHLAARLRPRLLSAA